MIEGASPATRWADPTVMVVRCEEYDREAMREIIAGGMAELKYAPAGKVFVKPNVVFANDPRIYGATAHTAAPFLGAALSAVAGAPGVTRIDVGEKSAVGFPTRLNFKHAGYYREVRRARRHAPCPVGIFCIEEVPRTRVFVGGQVHDTLRIARKMARADTKLYLPKLKCHCVSSMTGAVKLNIGICSDDERSIRHDFLLNEKIVDLLAVGTPDFIVMDAIEVGVGNEAFPLPRKLGLILMGKNPVAVDLIGARLLGFERDQVPYLKAAIDRGYGPARIEDVHLVGDVRSLADVGACARRLLPHDDEYFRWNDVARELARLKTPMRFLWGPYQPEGSAKCLTGCVMALKMFLGSLERFAGPEPFATARPVVFVIGRQDAPIDAAGAEAILIGSCAKAEIVNAKKIIHIDKCFTTASDLNLGVGSRLGMPSPVRDVKGMAPLIGNMLLASLHKLIRGRYFQDIGHFFSQALIRRI